MESTDATARGPIYLRPLFAFTLIWLLAFAARLIYLLQFRRAPFFDMLMGDGAAYDAWARRIAAGDWIGNDVFYQAPLYPYFLGGWYALAGTDLFRLMLAQIVIGATACLFLAAAGYRFFSPLVGLIAGLMLALYPSAIFFDVLVQKTVLDSFLMTLLLLLLSTVIVRPQRIIAWIGIGIALACLALTRENALVLAPLILVFVLIAFRDQPIRLRIRWAALLLAGWCLLLLTVAWRNYHVGGAFQLTTAQFGPNFFIGNNPAATGEYQPLRAGHGNALYEQRDATEIAEQSSGRKLSASQVSSFWAGQAFDFIRHHPLKWLSLTGRKILLTWNGYERSDTDDQYFSARWSSLLRGLTMIFHFGVLCPLALAGTILWKDRRRLWILYVLLLVYSLSVAIFYVFSRYRYPLVPILIVVAAAELTA